jgi:hypothetical protein
MAKTSYEARLESAAKHPLVAAFEAARADAKKAGTDKLTMKQIDAIIAKSRCERRASATRGNPRFSRMTPRSLPLTVELQPPMLASPSRSTRFES